MSRDDSSGNQTINPKKEEEEKRKLKIAELRAIVVRVKAGGTDPADAAEAARLNELLGGGFSNVVDLIKKTMDATNELAAKTNPATPDDLVNKPGAAVKEVDKFLKLHKVKDTLVIHDKMTNGKSTKDQRLTAINNAAEIREDRERAEAIIKARYKVIKAEIKAKPEALHQYIPEINDLDARLAKADKLAAIDQGATILKQKTGKTNDQIASDEMLGLLNGTIKEADQAKERIRDKGYFDLTGIDRAAARAAESKAAGAGEKRGGAPIPAHTTEYNKDPGASKTPDATPGSNGKSKGAGVGV